MKEAIKIEKSILRYRLCQIRNWALQRLKHQRETSLRIYKKLDDWIAVSNKAENDAIDEVCTVIKNSIEEEKKIQVELKINFMDFIIEKSVFNYIDPPPPKLLPLEEAVSDRFNIICLESLVKELAMIADSEGKITNRTCVELLLRKQNNSFFRTGALPKAWLNFGQMGYEKMVRNLDCKNTGSIDFKLLATCCILLKSSLPTDKEVDSLKRSLQ